MASDERETLVRLRGAAFGYAGVPVIQRVDFEVREGDFVGILGRNGSGKTTLLRGILDLIPAMKGSVEREGARMGFVPQRETLDAVYPVTVEEVVMMGAYGRLSGWRRVRREEHARVAAAIERVNLSHKRGDLFASLSGGQRQRALIARALVMRPNVLVLDEPTSGVDRPTQELVLDLLTELNEEDRLAIQIVSHQLEMTRTVRDVLWVEDGGVHLGSADEMLQPDHLAELFGVAVQSGHGDASRARRESVSPAPRREEASG